LALRWWHGRSRRGRSGARYAWTRATAIVAPTDTIRSLAHLEVTRAQRQIRPTIINQWLMGGEGWIPVRLAQPSARRNPCSARSLGRNFSLFSRVVAAGLFTAGPGRGAKSVLSEPSFSKPVDCRDFGKQVQGIVSAGLFMAARLLKFAPSLGSPRRTRTELCLLPSKRRGAAVRGRSLSDRPHRPRTIGHRSFAT